MDSQTTSQYVNVVDQLPPEILRTILHTSLELSDSDEFNHTQALRYSLVSQYWLEVVHSLPRYLNSVSISNDVAIVRLHDHIKRAEPGRLGSKIKTLRLCRSLNNLDKVSQLLHTCRNLESVYAYQPTILSWYFCRYETEWPTLTELELANINSFTSLELICKMCINLRKFWINGPSHHSIAITGRCPSDPLPISLKSIAFPSCLLTLPVPAPALFSDLNLNLQSFVAPYYFYDAHLFILPAFQNLVQITFPVTPKLTRALEMITVLMNLGKLTKLRFNGTSFPHIEAEIRFIKEAIEKLIQVKFIFWKCGNISEVYHEKICEIVMDSTLKRTDEDFIMEVEAKFTEMGQDTSVIHIHSFRKKDLVDA